MTDSLTPEQIELLRGLPSYSTPPGIKPVRYDEKYDDLINAGLAECWQDATSAGNPDTPYRCSRKPVANVLLATIDSAVAAERERVLNEVERIHGQLRLRRDEAQDMAERFKDDSERMAANCFDTAADDLNEILDLFANPQGETDQ